MLQNHKGQILQALTMHWLESIFKHILPLRAPFLASIVELAHSTIGSAKGEETVWWSGCRKQASPDFGSFEERKEIPDTRVTTFVPVHSLHHGSARIWTRVLALSFILPGPGRADSICDKKCENSLRFAHDMS